MTPGFGFKKETYGIKGKERSGSIEEASSLFGKDFSYTWDYAAVRTAVRTATEAAGYQMEVVLNPRSVECSVWGEPGGAPHVEPPTVLSVG